MKLESLFPENWRQDTTSKQDEVSAKNLRDSFDKETADKLFGPEKKTENFKANENITETMAQRRERLKAEGLGGDLFGSSKGGYKVSGLKQTSNVPAHSTQLMRYRWANQLKEQFTTDATLADGTKIRFAGTAITPGTEIFKVINSGECDLIKDATVQLSEENGGKFHKITLGKVTDAKGNVPEVNPNEDLTVKPLELHKDNFARHTPTNITLPASVHERMAKMNGKKTITFDEGSNIIVEGEHGEMVTFDRFGREI